MTGIQKPGDVIHASRIVTIKPPDGPKATFNTVRKASRDSVTDRLKVWVECDGLRSRVVVLDYTSKPYINSHHRRLEAELIEELKVLRALGVEDG